ncbi:type 1 fimbrial protein [Vibrio parahaemolyticus]|uniref:fimbrial protein n=1 Tax=Vibrio parahaemolyticus TaxID=670 RepID=UPI00100EAE16|nr:fimbrial protein [Vibrio parahaemolyticus]RXP52449.1 type 1 fimbrial protein [Vibrio parahaemolyticus]RXP52722.1 type 1 fimbrial protein [Vibrio parahaemolyticus]RXP65369.1 type 1 fimbrial protein [Vibrio parahaemolyticus]RXP70700.1 type 1 fimbrial protein [Vibrio parahaemolyticus]RXP92318.1 type 1 fimbrial protein [Vibrio parahaemolyticus]
MKLSKMVKKYNSMIFILILYFSPWAISLAYSACSVSTFYNHFISMSSLETNNTISFDWAPPQLLRANDFIAAPGSQYTSSVTCSNSGDFVTNYRLSKSFGVLNDYNGTAIVKTNVSGIGIIFYVYRNNSSGVGTWFGLPGNFILGQNSPLYNTSGTVENGTQAVNISNLIKYNLIKYGPTPNNFTLSASDMPCITRAVGHNGDMADIWEYCFGGTSISTFNTGTCDIANKTVQLGQISKIELDTNGSSDWINSDILLTNCSPFYGSNGLDNFAEIKLSPNNNGDYVNGIFNINSFAGSANGVALQLKSGITGNIINLDNTISDIFRLNSNTSTNITIPLQVRYKKTSTVSAGSVSASMIVTINYR